MTTKTLYIALGGAGSAVFNDAPPILTSGDGIVIVNTNEESLAKVTSHPTLLIGKKSLEGLGADRHISLGQKAIDESFADILLITKGYHQIVIISGINGGTGGNAGYLAKRLIDHQFQVGIAAIYPHFFESGHDQADVTISLLHEMRQELLFLHVFKIEKQDPIVKKDDGILEYFLKVNNKLIKEVTAILTSKQATSNKKTRTIVIDTETTGINPNDGDRLIEIACIEIEEGIITGNIYHQFINPNSEVPAPAVEVHGITSEFLAGKPAFEDIVSGLLKFIGDAPLVGHLITFHTDFLNSEMARLNLPAIDENRAIIDNNSLARNVFPQQQTNLKALAEKLDLNDVNSSMKGALLDAQVTAEIYLCLVNR